MRRAHDVDGSLGVIDAGQAHVQFDRELEAALAIGRQRDLGVDGSIVRLELGAPGHHAQCTLEACRVSDREELLGVGARPVAAHLDGLLANANRTVKALDPKTIKGIAGNIAGATSNINRFSAAGLRQYEQLAVDARRAVDTLDRAVRSFERDPSQVIFGPSQSVPEVQGR